MYLSVRQLVSSQVLKMHKHFIDQVKEFYLLAFSILIWLMVDFFGFCCLFFTKLCKNYCSRMVLGLFIQQYFEMQMDKAIGS